MIYLRFIQRLKSLKALINNNRQTKNKSPHFKRYAPALARLVPAILLVWQPPSRLAVNTYFLDVDDRHFGRI